MSQDGQCWRTEKFLFPVPHWGICRIIPSQQGLSWLFYPSEVSMENKRSKSFLIAFLYSTTVRTVVKARGSHEIFELGRQRIDREQKAVLYSTVLKEGYVYS